MWLLHRKLHAWVCAPFSFNIEARIKVAASIIDRCGCIIARRSTLQPKLARRIHNFRRCIRPPHRSCRHQRRCIHQEHTYLPLHQRRHMAHRLRQSCKPFHCCNRLQQCQTGKRSHKSREVEVGRSVVVACKWQDTSTLQHNACAIVVSRERIEVHSRLVSASWNFLFVTNPIAVRIIQAIAITIQGTASMGSHMHLTLPRRGLCIKVASSFIGASDT